MNFEKEYEESRKSLLNYLQIEDETLAQDVENLKLVDLIDILIEKHNNHSIYQSLIELSYENGLPYEKLDDFIELAVNKLDSLDEGEELEEDALINIMKPLLG